ncbi:MAG: nitroreductase family protein [Lachnospiraceae bacterium]|nr:nitroreductase family protein [Lachnospiraceae bacterium]MBQ7781319.1 nitroreductase family protein [Lachnospiraceae bacterium]
MNAIFHRVSIRKYQEKPVEQEKIITMLKAAMAAPSACNQQPWEYYVVTNKEKIEELSRTSPYASCAKDAPLVFVACARKEEGIIAPSYIEIDMSASVENLLLEADALNLGAVWLGIAPEQERMEAVRKVIDLPEKLYAFALLPCGYPAEERPQENRYEESRVHYLK